MWPLKSIISEKTSPVWRYQHTFIGFQRDRWEIFILMVNLELWPLKSIGSWKIEPWFWRYQHTFNRISKEKDGKPFIFRVNLGMLTPQINLLGKMSPDLRVLTHIYGVSKDIDGKMFIFIVKPGMWPLKIQLTLKKSPVLRVSTHMYMVSKGIDGKMFIFQVNLGMWHIKSIVSENQALFWVYHHTFMGFPRRYMGKHSCFK